MRTVAWALSLPRSAVDVLAQLYRVRGVQVGESGDELVWARGSGTTDELGSVLALVPTSRFYEVVADDWLRPKGRLLPSARLPKLRWIPFREWLVVRVPSAALPGKLTTAAELELVPSSSRYVSGSHEELLLCGLEPFREFMLHAPAHRLLPLRFVVNELSAEIIVRGHPLPSIPGERYLLDGGIATPAGLAWSPPVGASVVRAWLGVGETTFTLWRREGVSEISEGAFIAASRRAGHAL